MIEAATMRLTVLRKAIRNNRVSFPSQIPLFVRCAPSNLQRYSIQLYFLRGWSCEKIARRYGYSRFYIWQILNEWKRHAVSQGYLQAIPSAKAFVDLKNALHRTLEWTARLDQEKFKPCVDISLRVSEAAADPEFARRVEAWIRKTAGTPPYGALSAQASSSGKRAL
jgi:hypothetical protein